MFPIDLSDKKGIVFGVANDRSIAWGITQVLAQAGARIALTYQGDRLKERVEDLAGTLDGALTFPCDATDDQQIAEVFRSLKDEFGEISFLVHSIAFANREDLDGRIRPRLDPLVRRRHSSQRLLLEAHPLIRCVLAFLRKRSRGRR